jgi:sterol desaturase/sphingolipid hydroxylase (fatty acid hydroxylase superfamily)
MALASAWEIFRLELLSNFLRYALVAGALFCVYWIAGLGSHRRIQPRRPPGSRLFAEFGWSMSTVLVFAVVGFFTTGAIRAGWTPVYTGIAERGWVWLAASVVLMTLLHDAYFYWTHRLLHHRTLFARVHRVHHLSVTPSPWAAYAFHPLEALLQAGIFPLLVFLVPSHPLALFLFLLYMIVRNVIGHLGVETFPAGFTKRALTRWHTTTTHHDLHHRRRSGNYGLYFTWWDVWMKTERPDYLSSFAEVASRTRAVEMARGADELRAT